jgi:hypothetical protein
MANSQQMDLLQQKKENHCEENIYLIDDKNISHIKYIKK